MKKQVIIIRGGETFDTYDEYLSWLRGFEPNFDKMRNGDWKDVLEERLGKDYEVISPAPPNSLNAKYVEWKIWFEKLIPHFNDSVTLIGNSLGSIFLTKYLSENEYPKKIEGLFLVGAPFDASGTGSSLADFVLGTDLSKPTQQTDVIHFYFSEDDPAVPFSNYAKYQKALPSAAFTTFKDRGHFSIKEFPELVEDIKRS